MYSCCVFLLLGIQPHYPNKLCQPDAILTPSMDFIREEIEVKKEAFPHNKGRAARGQDAFPRGCQNLHSD